MDLVQLHQGIGVSIIPDASGLVKRTGATAIFSVGVYTHKDAGLSFLLGNYSSYSLY
jgi:hypothetical protein